MVAIIIPPWPLGVLSMSSKDCLVAKFACFSTSEKHLRIVFYFFYNDESKFSVT